jgi:hypothetical protein
MTPSSTFDGTEPIGDDELLYRRIPAAQGWFDPLVSPKPVPEAFRPRRDDLTGLSLLRGEPYNTAEQASRGLSKGGYYVAVLRAADLKKHGIEVVPRPIEEMPGHAEIVNLTAANRDSEEATILMVLLARDLCLRVEGPFHKPTP